MFIRFASWRPYSIVWICVCYKKVTQLDTFLDKLCSRSLILFLCSWCPINDIFPFLERFFKFSLSLIWFNRKQNRCLITYCHFWKDFCISQKRKIARFCRDLHQRILLHSNYIILHSQSDYCKSFAALFGTTSECISKLHNRCAIRKKDVLRIFSDF